MLLIRVASKERERNAQMAERNASFQFGGPMLDKLDCLQRRLDRLVILVGINCLLTAGNLALLLSISL